MFDVQNENPIKSQLNISSIVCVFLVSQTDKCCKSITNDFTNAFNFQNKFWVWFVNFLFSRWSFKMTNDLSLPIPCAYCANSVELNVVQINSVVYRYAVWLLIPTHMNFAVVSVVMFGLWKSLWGLWYFEFTRIAIWRRKQIYEMDPIEFPYYTESINVSFVDHCCCSIESAFCFYSNFDLEFGLHSLSILKPKRNQKKTMQTTSNIDRNV